MRLLTLLEALLSDIEKVKATAHIEAGDSEASYLALTNRYSELASYKVSVDNYVPGIAISDIKRKLKSSSNTFYSIHSGLEDKEITKASYVRQLSIMAVHIQEIIDFIKEACEKSSLISASLNKPITTQEPLLIVEAAAYSNTNQMFEALKDANADIAKAFEDLSEADKSNMEYLRKHQSAPSKPEDYRKLLNKNTGLPEDITHSVNETKNQHSQDDQHYSVLSKYQKALQTVKQTDSGSLDWVVSKGPIFFTSEPQVKELTLKSAKFSYDPFYPGWILSDQILIGIKPKLGKDKKELTETLNYAMKALSQRLPSKLVFMSTRKDKADKIVPQFVPLKGSKLLWTWAMLETKRNLFSSIRIKEWGFPDASTMRTLDSRTEKSILPELKQEASKTDELLKQYRIKIEQQYKKESDPLKEKLDEIRSKAKSIKFTIEDLAKQLVQEKQTMDNLKSSAKMSGTVLIREKIEKNIVEQENKLDKLNGRINGNKAIAKALSVEATSLRAQMVAMISAIRQQASEDLKKAREGIAPDDHFKIENG
ncbi:MAG: hypothetical protein KGH75_04875 [Rhodospirillales bacterium]|nr:hypothetical protein [Rhodospirillales bacterium]